VNLRQYIRDVPDFPIEGILFRDITPLLLNPAALNEAMDRLAVPYVDAKIDLVAGIESRGFIFGTPVAQALGAGFVPIRKPGKLPADTVSVEYSLEYGTNTLEMHSDAVLPGARVLIIDDLLATGGTAQAAVQLVEACGGIVVGVVFLIELADLNGRSTLDGYSVFSLITY